MNLDQTKPLLPKDLTPFLSRLADSVGVKTSNNVGKDYSVQVCGPVAGSIQYTSVFPTLLHSYHHTNGRIIDSTLIYITMPARLTPVGALVIKPVLFKSRLMSGPLFPEPCRNWLNRSQEIQTWRASVLDLGYEFSADIQIVSAKKSTSHRASTKYSQASFMSPGQRSYASDRDI